MAEIKLLEWNFNKDGTEGARAHTPFGDYCVYGSAWWREWTADKPVFEDDSERWSESGRASGYYKALIAANADFQRRVRECIG